MWSNRLGRRSRLIGRAAATGLLVYWWLWLIQSTGQLPPHTDAEAYWRLDYGPGMYGTLGGEHAFLYSPLAAQLLAPFTALPFVAFYGLLAAANLAALVWMLGTAWAVAALFFPPVSHEIGNGNIHLLLAASTVVAVRHPGWWAVSLLTKVTPGVAVLWHLFRREWSALLIVAGVTLGAVAISAVFAPTLWVEWVEVLATSDRAISNRYVLFDGWPLAPRLGLAVALVYVARNKPALLIPAAIVALPAVWVNSLAMLVAVVPLLRRASVAQPKNADPDQLPIDGAAASPRLASSDIP